MEHVLLLRGVGGEEQEDDRCLEGLLPLGLVGLDGGRSEDFVVRRAELEGVLLAPEVLDHEREKPNLEVPEPFVGEDLPVHLLADDVGPDPVLLGEGEADLLEDEFELFALREASVSLDVDVLQDGRGCGRGTS